MKVKKRDGRYEDVSFDKVLRRIQHLSKDLPSVDPSVIAQKICGRIFDGITTTELDELTARVCMSMRTSNIDLGTLGLRIIISNHHKNTPQKFTDAMDILFAKDILDPKVYEYIKENGEFFNNLINNDLDYNFDYFAYKTLERSYLQKVDGKIIERIQYLFLRVSCGIHYPDTESVVESYDKMSKKYFTHASPTLFNAGTRSPQLLSCFLTAPADSIEGMYDWLKNLALISKYAGGIGGSMSSIRGNGAYIRGTNGHSEGLIPFFRVIDDALRHVHQGGRRPGSGAMYLEPHHPDTMEFSEVRLKHGDESKRARNLFTGCWSSDLFMEAVENDEEWTLFDPDRCPGLDRCYGDEYRKLYQKYKDEGKGYATYKARDIWVSLLKSMCETGAPYMSYKDAHNEKSNHKHLGTIRGSNLCNEISEYHDENEYACCCLASICLSRFVDDKKRFNFKLLEEVAGQCVRNLNQVIDRNLYPVEETRRSNLRHRPLGIGVQGLADAFFKMRIPFERNGSVSPEADKLNQDIFETMYYGAMKASIEEAKKHGTYESFEGSPLSQGLFQFDLWKVKPSDRYDWDALRKDVIKHGARNSLLIACMPTASTAQIMGNTECFEPVTSNLYARETHAGIFTVINEYMVRDFMEIGLWSDEIKNEIIANNGSIQHIDGIDQNLKDLYKTAWELRQKTLIDLSAGRGPFICQTQSLNLFFEEPTIKTLTSALFYGWKKGLKTGSYYIRSRPKSQAQQFTIDPELAQRVRDKIAQKEAEEEEERPIRRTEEGLEIVCTADVCVSCSG